MKYLTYWLINYNVSIFFQSECENDGSGSHGNDGQDVDGDRVRGFAAVAEVGVAMTRLRAGAVDAAEHCIDAGTVVVGTG